MKKFFIGLSIVLLAASCTTVKKSSTTMDVATNLTSSPTADLEISENKATFVYKPTAKIRRGGAQNAKNVAVSELLKANGDADVLVHPQYEIELRRGFFSSKKIKKITVSGYPAKYKNFNNK